MRTKLVKRHYCDFCNKGRMVADSMRKHEATCLRNPRRGCFLCCENDPRVAVKSMPELIAALESGGVDAAREAANGCPACVLAAILQSMPENPEESDYVAFNYKAEKENWYQEKSAHLHY